MSGVPIAEIVRVTQRLAPLLVGERVEVYRLALGWLYLAACRCLGDSEEKVVKNVRSFFKQEHVVNLAQIMHEASSPDEKVGQA